MIRLNGWQKVYKDRSTYDGWDILTSKKKASWRNSSAENLVEVRLFHNQHTAILTSDSPSKWWQSDTYECIFLLTESVLTKRRIMKQLDYEKDKIILIYTKEDLQNEILFINKLDFDPNKFAINKNVSMVIVDSNWHEKWYGIEIDLVKNQSNVFIADTYF